MLYGRASPSLFPLTLRLIASNTPIRGAKFRNFAREARNPRFHVAVSQSESAGLRAAAYGDDIGILVGSACVARESWAGMGGSALSACACRSLVTPAQECSCLSTVSHFALPTCIRSLPR